MTMRFQGMFATSSDLPPGVLHFLGNVSALELDQRDTPGKPRPCSAGGGLLASPVAT
jgi:hypothetical protein